MPAGSKFCPECGSIVEGTEFEKQRTKEMNDMVRENGFNTVKFLLTIYAIPIIIIGIIDIVNASANANALWSNQSFQEWLKTQTLFKGLTLATLTDYFTYLGYLAVISGIGAAVSLVFVTIRRYWLFAVIGCMVAAIFCFWSIFGLFIGFFVTWMILDLKPFFEEFQGEGQ